MSRSYKDSYTLDQRKKVIDYLSQQRWIDAENGKSALHFLEVPFDENGNVVKGNRVLPDTLPKNPDPVLASFRLLPNTTGFLPEVHQLYNSVDG